ncbi:hypothetical protein TraAM80_08170 [Trypanosoma rangeli]|uniref:Methyltransferase domain-containing protein n=1 Tax=Trypanosoma rangeli TaxID=5698 RepID=A0A422N292_TRYRA|nr:uncharacterized protein TraAM80_08170 [Trypanosoma rangeli]RNE99559.1 hypothetical protein TraAM80_08170 [Trypanosoma rangeli]|eukprot:RNE99559.1 hypothetical protein TraAM80_08170 [Trypanosoma rangeli]
MAAMTSEPVICRRLYDCQKHVRGLLQDISVGFAPTTQARWRQGEAVPKHNCGARTLLELHELSGQFVMTLHATLFLPRDVVHEVDDFPMFLLRHFRRAVARANEERSWSDEEIVEGFVDWMDMALPAPPSSSGEGEVVSFVELMRLVRSFVRYHHGVRWGGGATKSEWYRGGYLLHPWHDTYCPTLHSEQMPYVHLLQWLLRRRPVQEEKRRLADAESRSASSVGLSMKDDAMRWWGATEPFAPPSWRGEGNATHAVGFAALDCGCHSGYMVDLLLKAGAQHVVGVDVAARALGSAEATLREHLRERRSATSVAKTMRFIRCDLLPELESVVEQATERGKLASPLMGEKNVLANAAARRRHKARRRCIPDNPQATASHSAGAVAAREGEVGPFDLLVFHPPMKPLFSQWPLLQELSNAFEYLPPGAEGQHPHCSLPVLHRLLQELLYSPKGQSDGHTPPRQRKTPLVRDGGYVAFILPRAFDPKDILQHISSSQSNSFNGSGNHVPFTSLSDAVTGALEGSYEVVLHRRHSLAGMCDTGEVPLCDAVYLREFSHPRWRDQIKRELNDFYRTHQAVDLLVFRKKPGSSVHVEHGTNKSNERRRVDTVRAHPGEDLLPYDESFEYTEYVPADGPPLQHHWTALMPSYSYLEDDFFGSNAASTGSSSHKRNFLALGHTVSPVREEGRTAGPDGNLSHADLQTLQRNMQNYRSLFTEELKTHRKRRLRKMALQSLEKQEWYIDEKLVKSEGAKIDLLNELSRFDLQDWD